MSAIDRIIEWDGKASALCQLAMKIQTSDLPRALRLLALAAAANAESAKWRRSFNAEHSS